MKRFILSALAAAAMLVASSAYAGPFILAGTDGDDHGSANATTNFNGWEFMQKSLQLLAPGVTTANKKVTILGSTSTALAAATSAFNLSSLNVGCGLNCWTLEVVSTANFGTFFGAGGTLGTGILMMDSGLNVSGGVDDSQFNPYSAAINNFLGAGGGLFSQANGYSWLGSLVPGLQVTTDSGSNLAVTAAGTTAFPGLTNADLSSGPWHNSFLNTGALQIFATSADAGSTFGRAVVIGGIGSITNPGTVPEPGTLALLGVALAAAAVVSKRKTA